MLGIKILIGAIPARLFHKELTIDGDRLGLLVGLLVGLLLGLIEGEIVTGLKLFDDLKGDYDWNIKASIF